MKDLRQPCWLLGHTTKEFESVLKGERHALDNLRNLIRAVAFGTGYFLHHGGVHPHPAGVGRHRSCNPAPARPESCLVEVAP